MIGLDRIELKPHLPPVPRLPSPPLSIHCLRKTLPEPLPGSLLPPWFVPLPPATNDLVLLAPVADSIKDAACVGDFESGQGDVAGREPAPIDGGEIAMTHDGLPQSVDAVVCFKGEEARLVRVGLGKTGFGKGRGGEETHRSVWHQCWYNSCPLCLEASRHQASNPRRNPNTAPGKKSCGWRSDSAADGTRLAQRCIGRRCRGSIRWRWAAGARPSTGFEIHRLLEKKSGQGWPLVLRI